MRPRHPSVLRGIPLAVLLLVTPIAAGCSTELDDFCDQLSDIYDFQDLRQAIDRDDRDAIEAALTDAQRLADSAPEEIEEDITAVVDALVDTVRSVIDVEGPDGQNMPVDVAQLNEALSEVSENAQRVQVFADEKCGITTTTTR